MSGTFLRPLFHCDIFFVSLCSLIGAALHCIESHSVLFVFPIFDTSICDAPRLSLKSVLECVFGIRL